MGFNKVTVKQFIELAKVDKDLPFYDRICRRLSILTGKPEEHFEAMEFDKLNALAASISFLDVAPVVKVKPVLWLRGTRYVLKDKPAEYNTSAYLAFKTYEKTKEQNIHHLLAWMYRPTFSKHNPEKAAADFLHAKITDVQGAFFLFTRKLQESRLHIQYSVLEAEQTLKDHLPELQVFMANYTNSSAGIIH